MDKLIETILTAKRCHNSKGEIAFMSWLRATIKTNAELKTLDLAEGCFAVITDEKSDVMFSCHTDTVHTMIESDGTAQKLMYDPNFEHIIVDKATGSCLGADDGAGIYIMLRMIEAKVPGTYVFHRGEEKGCVGSRAIVKGNPTFVEKFKSCVAFDRPGDDEIIIHQGGQICASTTYGTALAAALNNQIPDFKYDISTKGVITDSKIYRYDIPECVNIGVGYRDQHSASESLDWGHLKKLTEACIKVEWSLLPISRKPEPAPVYTPPKYLNNGYYGGFNDFDDKSFPKLSKKKKGGGGQKQQDVVVPFYAGLGYEEPANLDVDLESMDMLELEEICGGDMQFVGSIVKLMGDLAAEKARVTRLQKLLGLV